MSWSYHAVLAGDQWGIREVFRDDDGSISCWTEEPVYPSGETLSELMEDLKLMLSDVIHRPAYGEVDGKLLEIYGEGKP